MKTKQTIVCGIFAVMLLSGCPTPSGPDNPTPTTYTVTFNSRGGTNVLSQTVNENAKISIPAEPSRPGFVFIGWYRETAYTNMWNFASDTVSGHITLYAKWEKDPYAVFYTITFQANGGGEMEPLEVLENTAAITLPVPAKNGFIFAGWYEDEGLTVFHYPGTPVTGNIMLYAKWEEYSSEAFYTITFQTNGGGGIEPLEVLKNTVAITLPVPAKNGFIFAGWYEDEGLTVPYDLGAPVIGNITLYAKWDTDLLEAVNIDDFGPGVAITGVFTVSNIDEWNSALSAINSGGSGTAAVKKNYIINIAADFAVEGKTETSWSGPGYSPTFSVPYIVVSLRGKNRTLSLSSNGMLLFLTGAYQKLVIWDLTLKGRSAAVDGEDNNKPLIYVDGYGCVIDMKGDAAITGNSAPSYGVGAVRFPISSSGDGTFIMQDNAKIFGNGAEIAGVSRGNIIMRDNASIYNNFGTGISGAGSLIIQDNASIYNNADSPPNPYSGTITRGAGVYSAGDITMRDNAKITGNTGYGVGGDNWNVIMRDHAEVSGNGGTGISGSVTMQDNAKVSNNGGRGVYGGNVIMQNNASVMGNMGGGVHANSLTMTDYASISHNSGGCGVWRENGNTEVTMNDNTVISYNTGGSGVVGNVTMNGYAKIINNTSDGGGGGVRGSVTMRDNTEISGNTAADIGGGVIGNVTMGGYAKISNNTAVSGGGIGYNSSYGDAIITIQDNAMVSNNTAAETGGGVLIAGDSNFLHTFIMRDRAQITGNTARNAGGVYTRHTVATMRDYAKVIFNTASGDNASGGGVYAVGYHSSHSFIIQDYAEISGNTVTGNNASGGGVSVGGLSFFIMKDNASVSGNNAVGNNSQGGGMVIQGGYYQMGTVWMRGNAKVSSNSAQRGGGVYTNLDSYGYEGCLHMQDNAEVSGNTASVEGGGIYVRAWTYFYISGGTVYGNNEGSNGNTVNNGSSINGKGAALFKEANSTTQYGIFDGSGNFTPAPGGGNLATRDNTIRVVNGALQ